MQDIAPFDHVDWLCVSFRSSFDDVSGENYPEQSSEHIDRLEPSTSVIWPL